MTAPQPGMSPEFAAGLRDVMLQGLLREMETTKRVLAAIPEGKRDYRPDPKARTTWELAWHLAACDVQMTDEVADMKFEMEPRFKQEPKSIADMVNWYDSNFRRAVARVQGMKPEQLCTPVDFYGAFNMPVVFYLTFVNNHSIHHRGYLAAYLRAMGAKVPSSYGGSADEPWQG